MLFILFVEFFCIISHLLLHHHRRRRRHCGRAPHCPSIWSQEAKNASKLRKINFFWAYEKCKDFSWSSLSAARYNVCQPVGCEHFSTCQKPRKKFIEPTIMHETTIRWQTEKTNKPKKKQQKTNRQQILQLYASFIPPLGNNCGLYVQTVWTLLLLPKQAPEDPPKHACSFHAHTYTNEVRVQGITSKVEQFKRNKTINIEENDEGKREKKLKSKQNTGEKMKPSKFSEDLRCISSILSGEL